MRRAAIFCLLWGCAAPASSEPRSLTWTVSTMVGQVARVEGSPKIVDGAVEFDGIDDGLEVPALPIAGEREFTVEIVFRPDTDGPAEQRFLHLQEDGSESRLLIETRVGPGGTWWLDTYVQTEAGNCTLIDPKKTHPTGAWYSAALSFDGRTMRAFVNGREELSGPLTFRPLKPGRTSIGMRINRVFWFKGAVRTVRFTPRALPAGDLLRP